MRLEGGWKKLKVVLSGDLCQRHAVQRYVRFCDSVMRKWRDVFRVKFTLHIYMFALWHWMQEEGRPLLEQDTGNDIRL